MQIHTFEVSAMLTNETYYNIQNELKTRNRDKWKALKNGMQYWGLSDKGILKEPYLKYIEKTDRSIRINKQIFEVADADLLESLNIISINYPELFIG